MSAKPLWALSRSWSFEPHPRSLFVQNLAEHFNFGYSDDQFLPLPDLELPALNDDVDFCPKASLDDATFGRGSKFLLLNQPLIRKNTRGRCQDHF